MHPSLRYTRHREYPLPKTPWVMQQTWAQLLFMHWRVDAEVMAAALPGGLEPDTCDGSAWIAVVPFTMRDVYPRYTTAVPWLSHFAELNVRTYVNVGGKPGVLFFSLDAANPIAVEIARGWYRLPYLNARMSLNEQEAGWIDYASRRTDNRGRAAELRVRYRPTGLAYRAHPGTLEWFLTERYCLYTLDARGRLMRGEIHHEQWPLQRAEAEVEVNTLAGAAGFALDGTRPELLHFVRGIDVACWPIEAA
ncbi:MAG TPA: DUF2071 domain-containing protein [Anaerolineales bacterium]|nr:DUF2071 domain-containing protein [Anaerolineales bacterium]